MKILICGNIDTLASSIIFDSDIEFTTDATDNTTYIDTFGTLVNSFQSQVEFDDVIISNIKKPRFVYNPNLDFYNQIYKSKLIKLPIKPFIKYVRMDRLIGKREKRIGLKR